MLPSGDFYLCKTCYDQAIDFVGDPTVHHWNTVHVEVAGLGAETTYVVERCRICGDLRVDTDTEVVEWVGDDAPNETAPIPDAEAEAEDRRAEAADDDADQDERLVQEPYSGGYSTDP
jgi:hypothetical protein